MGMDKDYRREVEAQRHIARLEKLNAKLLAALKKLVAEFDGMDVDPRTVNAALYVARVAIAEAERREA